MPSSSSSSLSSLSSSSSSSLAIVNVTPATGSDPQLICLSFYENMTSKARITLKFPSGTSVPITSSEYLRLKIGIEGQVPVVDLNDTQVTANGSYITKTNPMHFELNQNDANFPPGVYDMQIAVLDQLDANEITLVARGVFILLESVQEN